LTGNEANGVLVLLSAGFPRQEWPEETKRLWRLELEEVGFNEGMAAAHAVIRGHEFLSFRVFYTELAAVRERHADQRGIDPRRALGPRDEPVASRETATHWLAKMRADLANARGPMARPLARAVATLPRLDEAYYDDLDRRRADQPPTEEETKPCETKRPPGLCR
jgi:hypothetical protein